MKARHLLLASLLSIVTASGGLIVWFRVIEPIQSHRDWFHRVRADIYSLADKRPANVPRGQWEFVIGWTVNLHGNNAGDYRVIDASSAEEFANELERILSGPVDLNTVDWIWDQYEIFSKGGGQYSDKYRPTRTENLADAGEGCFGIRVK